MESPNEWILRRAEAAGPSRHLIACVCAVRGGEGTGSQDGEGVVVSRRVGSDTREQSRTRVLVGWRVMPCVVPVMWVVLPGAHAGRASEAPLVLELATSPFQNDTR